MLLGKSDVQSVIGGGSLELEVEAPAEALAERESPGLVNARAEWGMYDKLHAAAFVEEAFGDDCFLGRDGPENSAAFHDVLNRLAGARFAYAAFVGEPGDGFGNRRSLRRERDWRNSGSSLADLAAQLGDM